ncbi:ketopantoate reductase PanE/ApbA C terminal-domain-containing protein [Phlyctochytrium arcticum]|nr:ketopantoate reductase PanE/ApbA C terminal-domain-containing protein [Phlyctochytrium arcticum]
MASGVHVLGAGAIGLLHAFYLRKALQIPVTLLLRPQALLNFERIGKKITLESEGGVDQVEVNAELSDGTKNPQQINTLLVCTKAQDTISAVSGIQHRLISPAKSSSLSDPKHRSTVILLQNGVLGVFDELNATLPSIEKGGPRFLLGMTTHGVTLKDRFTAIHTGSKGESVFGAADPLIGAGAEQAQNALMQLQKLPSLNVTCSKSYEDLRTRLLMKVAINTCVNPIAALFNCLNGQIANSANAQNLIAQLSTELATVLMAENLLDASTTQDSSSDVEKIERLAAHFSATSLSIAAATASNRNSMLEDVTHGRRTEIDYIVGYIVNLAKARGVKVPTLQFVLNAIKFREELGCV